MPRLLHKMRMLFAGVLFTLVALDANADDRALEQARQYFQAGAQAYAVGEFEAAIQAFEQAYQLVPRPAVLFSIAQAERKQYFLDHKAEHIRKAVELYRRYLNEESQTARKGDAAQALSELEPLVAHTAEAETKPDQPVPVAAPMPTRLMITSQAEAASISIDDEPGASSPLIREVEPGEHRVRVTAPGYVDSERNVVAVKSALVTVDFGLTELPAKLIVVARDGALLSIDGRVQGECPFPKPIELSAGSHLVTLTLSGYVGVSREQQLERGQTTVVRAPMPRTLQRTTSLIMLGAAASAVTAGGVFAYFANQQQGSARDIADLRGKSQLSPSDMAQYNSNHQDRDRLRTAALVSVGIGAALGIGGALLIAFDSHAVEGPPESDRKSSATRHTFPPVGAEPLVGPGLVGLSAHGAF